jgi:hypothetical protein
MWKTTAFCTAMSLLNPQRSRDPSLLLRNPSVYSCRLATSKVRCGSAQRKHCFVCCCIIVGTCFEVTVLAWSKYATILLFPQYWKFNWCLWYCITHKLGVTLCLIIAGSLPWLQFLDRITKSWFFHRRFNLKPSCAGEENLVLWTLHLKGPDISIYLFWDLMETPNTDILPPMGC